MGLRERLNKGQPTESTQNGSGDKSPETPAPRKEGPISLYRSPDYHKIKKKLHEKLIDYIDSAHLKVVDSPGSRKQIRSLLEHLLEKENPPLNQQERKQMLGDLEDETFGLGPLEPILRDPLVTDILVNRHNEVYIEKAGRLEKTDVTFKDKRHLLQVIHRIVGRVGRRIDESSPMVDARLPDGSRVNAIIPPLAVDGPVLSIRRFYQKPLTMADLVRFGSLDETASFILESAVKAKCNLVISGGTGSGKTTLLNVLLQYVGKGERLVSIEDTAELRPVDLHCIRLETRPPNIEGQGEVTQRNLVKNALRMRPDRILVGEVRGPEAFDMMHAMNTGHKGSLTTIHANSPRGALAQMELMVLMAGVNLTSETIRRQISAAIDLVVQIERFPDGIRRVVSICEITGMESEMMKLQELFHYEYEKGAAISMTQGRFAATGILPAFLEQLQRNGVSIPINLFNPAPSKHEKT